MLFRSQMPMGRPVASPKSSTTATFPQELLFPSSVLESSSISENDVDIDNKAEHSVDTAKANFETASE